MERSPPLADDLPDGQRSNGHGKSLTKEEDTLLGGEVDCKSRPWGLRGDSNSSSCSPSSSTPNNEFLPLDRSDIKQAASFVLACNKQTQGGLQVGSSHSAHFFCIRFLWRYFVPGTRAKHEHEVDVVLYWYKVKKKLRL